MKIKFKTVQMQHINTKEATIRMASNKITQEELVKYIMFILQGNAYLQSQAKGDTEKLKTLESEIENIGTKNISLANVGVLLNTIINEVIMPQFQQYSEELLLVERIIKGDAVAVDKLDGFIEELHKNGDLSNKSYEYYKSSKMNVSENNFERIAKEVKQEIQQNNDKSAKAKEIYNKEVFKQSNNSDKTAVTKATDSVDKEEKNIINLNGHRK